MSQKTHARRRLQVADARRQAVEEVYLNGQWDEFLAFRVEQEQARRYQRHAA
jgi:hypothetical protein